MRVLIYIEDQNIQEKINALIIKYSGGVDIELATSIECLKRAKQFNYAFISDEITSMPWQELMAKLSNSGVKTYLITKSGDSEIYNIVRKAGGRRVITFESMENDIKVVARGIKKEASSKPNRRRTISVGNTGFSEEDHRETTDIAENGVEDQDFFDDEFSEQDTPYDITRLNNKKFPGIIVSVHGAKGGVGKTTISANIAVGLSLLGLKTVIVDLDVENGNLASVLHVSGSRTIKDWVKGNVHEDEKSLLVHESGLSVLQGLVMPAEASLITAEVTERILSRLARRFDVVVADTGTVEIDPMIVAMKMSEKCYIVADYDLTRAPNILNLLNDARMLGIDLDKMKLILNNVPDKRPARQQDLLNNIPIQFLTEIRQDNYVPVVANDGGTPYIDKRCSRFSEDLFIVIEDILESTEFSMKLNQKRAGRRGGLLGWLGL